MDIEQLKLVIQLVKELADGALWGFILYLSVAYVLPYVFGTIVLAFLYKFFSGLVKAVHSFDYWKELAEELGYSPYNGYGHGIQWEHVHILAQKIREALKK